MVFTHLPKNVLPERYALRLQTDFQNFTFDGDLKIEVLVVNETSEIILNAAEIVVQSALFTGQESQIATISYDNEEERVIFTFPVPLKVGTGTLSLKYSGILNDKLKGYYRSKYTINGETRFIGTTQFEPPDARRAFPCWDEPEHRAVFSITLVVPPNRVAVSNMPPISEKQLSDDGTREIIFEDSPKMPSYLVAWCIGEFDFLEERVGKILYRMYVPPGKSEQGKYALSVAVKALPFFEDWFGIEYPLPKMDLVAVPDFGAGAMENWGCVICRETAILVDPQHSGAKTRQWVSLVVCHEFAHQWFGNLVTMKWWTHLWLNEGFATWIQYMSLDHLFPEWQIWTQYACIDLHRAMTLDALKSSHPIEVEVHSPKQIDEAFDTIAYSKGSGVIRMLAAFLGPDVFKRGLHHYLNKHKLSNAATEDLWEALSFVSGKSVETIMNTWTKQTGYPVLFVTEVPSEKGRKFQVKQQRFLSTGLDHSDPTLWHVPLSYITSSIPTTFTLISERNSEFVIDAAKKEEWVKFNAGSVGLYRVRYSPELLAQLSPVVTQLPALDRIQLETDEFAFAQSGVSKTTEYLDLLLAYREEEDYTVWNNIHTNLSGLKGVLRVTSFYDTHFTKFQSELFGQIFAKIGWDPKDGEGHLTGLLRTVVIHELSHEKAVIDEALKRFENFPENGDIAPDLRIPIYLIAVRKDPKNYEKLIELYKKSDLNEEKVRLVRSLADATTPELMLRSLNMTLDGQIRQQDCHYILEGIAVNRNRGPEVIWSWFTQNWETLFANFQGFLASKLVTAVTAFATSREQVIEIKEFFHEKSQVGYARTVAQGLEAATNRIAWREREAHLIEAWLKNRYH